MNENQVKGRIKEAEGKAKEVTGRIVGNRKMQALGALQKTAGKAQADYGDFKNDLNKANYH